MSLLEVLISIFVLSIGLLGVAALIPVGRHEMVEGAKADRSAVVGRAALREVKIRRMLEYYQYDANDPSRALPIEMWDPPGVATLVATGSPPNPYVLIDPLYFRENAPSGPIQPPHDRFPNDYASPSATMPRVDLRSAPLQAFRAMRFTTLPEQVFVWHDDLLFDGAGDPGRRPAPVVSTTTGQPQFEGNYSWMAMVRYDTQSSGGITVDMGPRATVWVIVFYKRNLQARNAPEAAQNAERVAGVTFPGLGLSGGDVMISMAAPEDAERLKVNQWLFLGAHQPGSADVSFGAWYRVVRVAPGNPNDPGDLTRYVTLAGPDWPTNLYPVAEAVLMRGVINVFSETVELNRDLLRARQ